MLRIDGVFSLGVIVEASLLRRGFGGCLLPMLRIDGNNVAGW